MGIFKKLTCKHTRALYYEERIENVLVMDNDNYETKIVRTIVCPDCGIKFDAIKADRLGLKTIMSTRRNEENKNVKCSISHIKKEK